ncbi:MAG: asparagine synthase (glutamine-hydrolyzing) [Cyclobacteriaceae bacterium]|nr:asparagine synthase (glutamine-hydrolyzing) [Cyclobacteriaceae bacterium]
MCGINVIFDFSGKAETSHLHRMMKATHHRGPDTSNFLKSDTGTARLFMGANRLQIIDKLEASNQPLVSLNGRYALVFNGEIYNYEEIRNDLLHEGIQFNTHSDTEVLLFQLIKRGIEGIAKLNGMFAFVFADLDSGELIVARDRMGIKPLFVHKSKKQIIISSEINGILASGLVAKELNEEVIPHYLAYKYAPRPSTFYKQIEEIEQGAIWEVTATGRVEKSIIQAPSKSGRNVPLKNLLIDAVVQQYSQANTTGIMLSGGVDSTLLLAILNKELGYNHVPVYSIAGTGKDSSYASQAARQYKAEYNEVNVTENTLSRLDEYLATIDQPIADSAALLTWLIAEKASGNSKVLLSGAGADELFAGYNRHKAFYTYLKNRDKLWFKEIKKAGQLPNWSGTLSGLKKMAKAMDPNPSVTFNNFIQSDFFRLTPAPLWEEELSVEQHLRNGLLHDLRNYLESDVLAITDHATMQHSIEARVPYLDAQVIAFSENISSEELLADGNKWMLKEILIGYEGGDYAKRKKHGLGLPINSWFKKQDQKDWWDFNQKESQIHTFVTSQVIDELIQKHQSGKVDHSQELWRILVLHKWLEHNF